MEGVRNGKNQHHIVCITDEKTTKFCTGALLNDRTVLTCAHTLMEKNPNDLKVRVSRDGTLRAEGEVIDIENIIFHPDFNYEATTQVDRNIVQILDVDIHNPEYMISQTQSVVANQRFNLYGPDVALIKLSSPVNNIDDFPSIFSDDIEESSFPLSLKTTTFGSLYAISSDTQLPPRRHVGEINNISLLTTPNDPQGVLYAPYETIAGDPKIIKNGSATYVIAAGDSGAPLFTEDGKITALVHGAKHVDLSAIFGNVENLQPLF